MLSVTLGYGAGGGDVVGDLLLGRAQRLPQANFSGDEEE